MDTNYQCVFKSGPTPALSLPPSETAQIGMKDLRIVEVVKKIKENEWGDRYECVLTFNDKIKASCDLNRAEVDTILYNHEFDGTKKGIVLGKRTYSKFFFDTIHSGPNIYIDSWNNSWVSKIHKETKENLQKVPSMSGDNQWVERVKGEEVEFKQKSKENKRADL